MARGIKGSALGRMASGPGDGSYGAPVFILHRSSTLSAGTTSTETIVENAPFRFQILRAWFVCTEAANNDSEDVKLTDGGDNDITDTADYSTLGDKDSMEFSEYDDAYWIISKGDDLKLVKTATTAVTSIDVFVLCARVAG